MIELELLQELCGGCHGCSIQPTSLWNLCSNPLEKYVAAKTSIAQTEAYFRGRRDGLTILEANAVTKKGGRMENHWICYVEGTDGGKKYRHRTLESAQIEADRLARLPNVKGKRVYVYEYKGSCQVIEQPITWDIPLNLKVILG